MDRFQPISITNSSLGAHLYPSEEVYLLTPSVGLYSGPYKSLPHASGTIYLTTHRLFYVDDAVPHSQSCFLPLELIRESQYYAGFLKSSPKVTLVFDKGGPQQEAAEGSTNSNYYNNNSSGSLGRASAADKSGQKAANRSNGVSGYTNGAGSTSKKLDSSSTNQNAGQRSLQSKTWICRICAFSNPIEVPSSSSALDSTVKCQLCGVNSAIKDLVLEESKVKVKQSNTNTSPLPTIDSTPPAPLPTSADGVSCPVCTFANHPSMSRCEMCDTPLGTEEPIKPINYRKSGEFLPSGAQTPTERDDSAMRHDSVRLSFRKGGDKAFYTVLKTTLKEKSWQAPSSSSSGNTSRTAPRRDRFSSVHRNIDGRTASSALAEGGNGDLYLADGSSSRRVGIEGIFSAVDLQAREESGEMQDAFRDLEALMARAKKMVDLAENLNAKLTRQEANAQKTSSNGTSLDPSTANDETANIIRSSLVRLGLPTPAITADMAKDEMEYSLQLARELAGLLYEASPPLLGRGRVLHKSTNRAEKGTQRVTTAAAGSQYEGGGGDDDDAAAAAAAAGRGIIPLDELWCMWNRARGIALVSPRTLLDVCKVLPSVTIPSIECKTFPSGLCVLHTSRYQSETFSKRILGHLQAKSADQMDHSGPNFVGITTLEIAKRESCPLHLVSELLQEMERETGSIARDDQGEVTWYENQITSFDWDRWRAHQKVTTTSTLTL